ncbi:MAG: hypothetical protein R6W84_11740 [Promethearchaeia archaeon]
MELRTLAPVAKIFIVRVFSRKESRGIHYNVDYPNKAKIERLTNIERP